MTDSRTTADLSLTREALKGKRVVLTGTTGYLGKVILEKLLRSVPDIGEIILLIRTNREHATARDRFEAEVATSTVFDHLRETAAEALERAFRNKVHCVSGEITQSQFGLSYNEYRDLAARADVFINSAASVNFREELDKALTINTLCLNEIVAFSQAAGDIPVLQISTCYVNGYNQGSIPEAVSAPASGRIPLAADGFYDIEPVFTALQQKIEAVRERYTEADSLSEALIDLGQAQAHFYGWGDTYTFTKWLGEQLLLKRLGQGTLTIVRPSVIESCLQEPAIGWIEGVKVTDAILLAYARGKVSVFPGRKAGVVDIIPADLVANSVIISMAEALLSPGQTRIYQSCSGSRNPLNVAYYVSTICNEVKDNWQKYPRLVRKEPRKRFKLVNKTLFVGLIQAMRLVFTLGDRLRLRTSANKSRGLKAVETTLKLTRIYSTYTSPRYVFDSSRLMALSARMGEVDQALFPVDAALIDWHRYFTEIHVAGLNHYGMEDRSETSAESAQSDMEQGDTPVLASQGQA